MHQREPVARRRYDGSHTLKVQLCSGHRHVPTDGKSLAAFDYVGEVELIMLKWVVARWLLLLVVSGVVVVLALKKRADLHPAPQHSVLLQTVDRLSFRGH